MADVFISYKREEKHLAQRLHDALEQFGFSVWFDVELLSGDEFRPVIKEMIDKCSAVVVLWSPLSVQSQFVIDEAGYAQRNGKLCPALLAPCELPFGFGGAHADSLVGWDGQLRHDGFNRLLGSIERHTGKEARLGSSTQETARQRAEITAFQAVAKLRSAAAWKTFLKDYPGTSFRRFIEDQIRELQAATPVAAATPAPATSPSVYRDDARPKGETQTGWMMAGAGIVAAVAALGVFALIDPLDWIPDGDAGEGPPPVMEAEVGRAEARQPDADASPDGGPRPALPREPEPDAAALDDAAWATAQERATVSAYRDYLADDANTGHRGRVETALQRHEQAVLRLQTALNAKGFEAGAADGQVGRQTRAAVEAYRRARGFDIASVDLAAIDPAPIQDFAESVERWSRPAPEPVSTAPTGTSSTASTSASTGYRAGQTFRDTLSGGGQGPEMVVVSAGSFSMGSPAGEAGRDEDEDDTAGPGGRQRTVRINYQFAVGKFEVTWAEWEACVADGGCNGSGPEGAGGDNGWGRGNRPVIEVDWNDAQAYVQWLSRKTGERYRLLSEAEWEYVARAGTTGRFSWGDGDPTCSRGASNGANFVSCTSDRTEPVGYSAANAFGVHDMHGNVWEWTQDCYVNSYSGAPTDGSARLVSDCSRRVLRGGSWNFSPQNLRSANRNGNNPTTRNDIRGFRVARTL